MHRGLLLAFTLSLAAVIGTVEMMRNNKQFDVEYSQKGIFPAFERHELNELMSDVKEHRKQEAEQATRLLSKIAERAAFNRGELEKIERAAHLVLEATQRKLLAFERDEREALHAEIRLFENRSFQGTESLETLRSILMSTRHLTCRRCTRIAQSCTQLIADYRELGPAMHGDRMFPAVYSEVGDLTETKDLVARRDALIALEARLRKKIRDRREELIASEDRRNTHRFRAA